MACFDENLFYAEQARNGLTEEYRLFVASVCHIKYEDFPAKVM